LGKAKIKEGQTIDCVGTVLFGATSNTWFEDIFHDHHGKKTYGKKRSNGKMKCSTELFGDVAPGLPKHCWCDADKDLAPYELAEGSIAEKCAGEGEMCNCTTTVHYGDASAKDFSELSKGFFYTKDVSDADQLKG
jgi:hypothetical protein